MTRHGTDSHALLARALELTGAPDDLAATLLDVSTLELGALRADTLAIGRRWYSLTWRHALRLAHLCRSTADGLSNRRLARELRRVQRQLEAYAASELLVAVGWEGGCLYDTNRRRRYVAMVHAVAAWGARVGPIVAAQHRGEATHG